MKIAGSIFFSFLLLALITQGNGEPAALSKQSRYTSGCLDSSKIMQLYTRGQLEDVITEIDAFKRYIRISPKPCDIFTDLYFGVSKFALGDSVSGRLAWQAMLKLDPQKEIWEFQLPLFLQARFDELKRDLWATESIVDPYEKDYIPATYPNPHDDAQLQTLRALYHNARLTAYLGSYETLKHEMREYFLECEKRKVRPDPAMQIIKGELMRRNSPSDQSSIMQAMVLVQAGMEADKQSKSLLVDSRDLKEWGDRILRRHLSNTKDRASGK